TTGFNNAIFGNIAGERNDGGSNNSFFGFLSGSNNTTGADNTFVGSSAGVTNTKGDHITTLGAGADVGSGALSYAAAIGAGAVVNASNTIVLGRDVDSVRVPGNLITSGGAVNATTQYNLGGARVLSAGGPHSIFTGFD